MRKDPLKINSITCAMGAACTLWNPAQEFRDLKKPPAVYIGGDDGLFDPRKVMRYFDCLDPAVRKSPEAALEK